jgi:hypothetical protein
MNEITLIIKPITREQLRDVASRGFGDMVKGVVDIEKAVMALGGELHADEEAFLLEKGSTRRDLWASIFTLTWTCLTCWNLIP